MGKQPSIQTIKEALSFIPSDCDRDTWVCVGMALKSELDGGGFTLFEEWSQGSDSYNKQDTADTWKSISSGGGVGIATLFYLAKQHGWVNKGGPPPDKEEIEARRRQAADHKAKEEAERQRKAKAQERAKQKAQQQWEAAKAADNNHPYLVRKKTQSHGLRIAGDVLLVPLADPSTGEIWNLQSIHPKPILIRGSKEPRDKDFIPGARKAGLCHFIPGQDDSVPLCIVEGYATGATVHEATGWAVFVAFDSGNLKWVAEAVRAKHPNRKIIIAADNDQWTKGNPGIKKANEASKIINAMVATPVFPKKHLSAVPKGEKGPSDWNDLARLYGIDEARNQLSAAIRKAEQELPRGFFLSKAGLFHDDPDNPQGPFWVCSPLRVTAVTRDDRSKEWGRLLEWEDMDGKAHHWAAPMQMMAGDGNEYRRVLLDSGLRIGTASKARNLLSQYIQTCNPSDRARCVTKTGWYQDTFVLPDEVIGQQDEGERVLLQTSAGDIVGYGIKGTLEEWREGIAAKCTGNSRLALAVSLAFAPILQDLLQQESGGFHFRGGSSIGKSTLLYVAASIWGGPEGVRRWRTTDNGLESLAQSRNDSLLCLDELKELDPKIAGNVVYMLANGQGKQRSGRSGEHRIPVTWRLLFVSTGELPIAEHIRDGGGRVYAGQEVRIADIQADASKGLGVFEDLHGMESGVHLSQHLMQASKRAYGHPSRVFIRHVAEDREGAAIQVHEMRRRFAAEFVPVDADGQVYRVADRFALVAAAGELATSWGVTGWKPGEATLAAKICFRGWVKERGGTGKKEDSDVIRQIRRFLQEHGDARFVPLDHKSEFRTMYRSGYRGRHMDETIFYVLTEVFKDEMCKGLDPHYAARVLHDRGYLHTTEKGRFQTRTPVTPDDGTRPRTYAIKGRILEDG